ncbi:hypothetical protein C8R46DRAFT_1046842 [Mycena filopes]|nr:hypothetical protein C8R46DRAFT_1046842 [Mycena filopes]
MPPNDRNHPNSFGTAPSVDRTELIESQPATFWFFNTLCSVLLSILSHALFMLVYPTSGTYSAAFPSSPHVALVGMPVDIAVTYGMRLLGNQSSQTRADALTEWVRKPFLHRLLLISITSGVNILTRTVANVVGTAMLISGYLSYEGPLLELNRAARVGALGGALEVLFLGWFGYLSIDTLEILRFVRRLTPGDLRVETDKSKDE